MPITYSIDHKLGIVRETWTGEITVDDVRAAWTHYLTDPEILALRATLADVRGASFKFSAWDVRRLIQTLVDPMLRGRDWITAIVLSGPSQLDMTRHYQELAEHYSRDAIFFSEGEALQWLIHERIGLPGEGRWSPWGQREQPGEPH